MHCSKLISWKGRCSGAYVDPRLEPGFQFLFEWTPHWLAGSIASKFQVLLTKAKHRSWNCLITKLHFSVRTIKKSFKLWCRCQVPYFMRSNQHLFYIIWPWMLQYMRHFIHRKQPTLIRKLIWKYSFVSTRNANCKSK